LPLWHKKSDLLEHCSKDPEHLLLRICFSVARYTTVIAFSKSGNQQKCLGVHFEICYWAKSIQQICAKKRQIFAFTFSILHAIIMIEFPDFFAERKHYAEL